VIQLLMAAALAVLAAARLPVLIRHRKDTVFVAAGCACGAALLTNPGVYVFVDHALSGINLTRLLMQALMVTGLWFLRRALLQAVAPNGAEGILRQLPLYTALSLLVILFLLIGPTSTTTSWGDQFEGILVAALFSFTGIVFVAWVCGEIAVVCLAHLRTLQGAFRIGFTMVSAGCSIGCLTMTLMSIGVLARAIPALAPLHWRDPDGYRVLELASIALVGVGLTITAVRGHRARLRIARWERNALTHVAPIRENALNEAGLKGTLECDDSAPVQDRLHRMIVEIWDAELAAGTGRTVLTPEQRTYLLDVERTLDLEHPG
jgi:hypothetical protein